MKLYQSWLVVCGLVIYVGALGALTADNVFQLRLFPSRLERLLAGEIARLDSPDPKVRQAAQDEIVGYHEFSIPLLIRALRSGDAQRKERCAECLSLIARKFFLSDADYGPHAGRWSQWWRIQQAADGFRDEQPQTRSDALERIVVFGSEAIPILIDMLRDPNKTVQVLAADGLVQIVSAQGKPAPDCGLDREKWLAWWKSQKSKAQ